MRKVDPDAVRRAFVNDAQELNNFRSRTAQAIQGGPHEQADISRLASTTFLSLYVAFETFLSDLFLAYLNRDFTTTRSGSRVGSSSRSPRSSVPGPPRACRSAPSNTWRYRS
jgi:hypothetical protein